MNQPFTCEEEEKDTLVALLYDEVDPSDRERVEAHLAGCAACREEVAALRGVRTTLADWAPATRALGFRLVQTDPAEERRRRSWWPLPVWAQAAAAVLILGVAAGLANLDVTLGTGGVSVRTGWQHEPAAAATVPATVATEGAARPWRVDLAALEERLRKDFTVPPVLPQALGSSRPASGPSAVGEDQLLARFRTELAESEQRQQRELALRVAQLQRDIDGQRRADLRRIQDNLGQLGGWTGAEVARQRDMLNYLLRVSSQQIK